MFHLIVDICLMKPSFQLLVAPQLVVRHYDHPQATHTYWYFVWLEPPHALCLLSQVFEFMNAGTHFMCKVLLLVVFYDICLLQHSRPSCAVIYES